MMVTKPTVIFFFWYNSIDSKARVSLRKIVTSA